MNYELTGNIYKIENTKVITDTFSKREVCITIPGDYPQTVALELHKEKCDLIESMGLSVGDEVTACFNLNGRCWIKPETGEERVFNTLSIWRIEKVGAQMPPVPSITVPSITPAPEDDIPF